MRTTVGTHRLYTVFAMRVIAGSHRGRTLHAPRGRETRPTSDRVREALFSILGELAESTDTTDEMIRALRSAVDNGATTVIQGLSKLPREWATKIAPAKE